MDADRPDDNFVTFEEYRLLSKRLAVGLQRAGLSPGDRALLSAGNSIHFPCIFMGIVMAGGIFTGASPLFGPRELAHQLKDSGSKFFIVHKPGLATALEAADTAGLARSHIYVFDGVEKPDVYEQLNGAKHWTELLADATETEQFEWFEPRNPKETTCCLNYSSGTTGSPKGVEITHFSYVANGEACVHHESSSPSRVGRGLMTGLCFLPMYHAAGQTTYIANSPKMGYQTAIMSQYSLEAVLRHIQTFKISTLSVAPVLVLQLSKSPLTAKHDLSSIQEILSGTAPLSPEVAAELEKIIWPKGENFIRQGWGMTEITCAGLMWAFDDKQKSSSVGEAIANSRIMIRDGDKEITEPNKPGELWFSGPTLMKTYWRNPKAYQETVAIDKDGTRWMKTGDVAYVDRYEPGAKVYLVDRMKELIKVRGFQVAPSELEGVLLDRKDITDAGVVGVQVHGEEVPRAFVVRASKVTEQEIMAWVEQRVAKYKQLRGGVVFVESIPRTLVSFIPPRAFP